MTLELTDPPQTRGDLQARAQELAERLQLKADTPGEASLLAGGSAADQDPTFRELRTAARALASSSVWRRHDLTTDLLLLVEQLRDAIDANPGSDPEWRVRELILRIGVVARAMAQRMMDSDLDQPERAAQYIASELADLGVGAVAALLATTDRMVNSYRSGTVGRIRKNPERLVLIAHLVEELSSSMTARGVLLWFDVRRPQLGGRTPRELLDEDPITHAEALRDLARGGRAQLDRGDVSHDAVDEIA